MQIVIVYINFSNVKKKIKVIVVLKMVEINI